MIARWTIVFFLLGTTFLRAQTIDPVQKLAAAKADIEAEQKLRKNRIQLFVQSNPGTAMYRDKEGNLVVLYDVNPNGIPIYEVADNKNAAITTGVTQLRTGGNVGVNLEGEGITFGVWDGGAVKNHIELDGRIISVEGSQEDTHATHVTGTIAATGINANAKGMAPKAKAYTRDFNNDIVEMTTMAKPNQSSLLLSNHSYGQITGWRYDGTWQWFGDANVSTSEDYKFGFYDTKARQWDAITNGAPYYLICKSAGNDRSDSGPVGGNRPADCNGGEGYDCIGDAGTAKNVLTVGAVKKVLSYASPASVEMSSFSSWGPTDDGRIKPDIVADGVDVFSLSADGDNTYTTLSGTSMATPNATGSLVLVQELYNKIHPGNYLRSATLKALAIQTAKESGAAPGPDYRFGWGLLSVDLAAKMILKEDGKLFRIEEATLTQGETMTYTFDAGFNAKVTATIVWNDPAGSPAAAALDPVKLMLVNDLDMRITNGVDSYLPWILDPAVPTSAATNGDNIRDNVEKIEFTAPSAGQYGLSINHKNTLSGGSQSFSLIISVENTGQPDALYWVGNSGSWSSPLHWSYTSGGPAANRIPTASTRIYFDDNSFSAENRIVSLSDDALGGSFLWLTKRTASLDMNGHILNISGDFKVTNTGLSVEGDGVIKFSDSDVNLKSILFTRNDLNATLQFDGPDEWKIEGDAAIDKIEVIRGDITMSNNTITLSSLVADAPNSGTIDISNTTLEATAEIKFGGNTDVVSDFSKVIASTTAQSLYDFASADFDGSILVLTGGDLQISGDNQIDSLTVAGTVSLLGSNSFNFIQLNTGSQLSAAASTQQNLDRVIINSSAANRTSIVADGPASIDFTAHTKLCFDNLVITNVSAIGQSVVSVGTGSELSNGENWIEKPCDEVLFPNFETQFLCVGSLVEFINESEGAITTWDWDFGDGESSAFQNPEHIYTEEGTYEVTLTVSDETQTETYMRSIEIGSNGLAANEIIFSGDKLFSKVAATSYQWYHNGLKIEGETARTFLYDGTFGEFFVTTSNGTCNRPSSFFIITGVDEKQSSSFFYPNPVRDFVKINLESNHFPADVMIHDILGRSLYSGTVRNADEEISLGTLKPGLYLVRIRKNDRHLIQASFIKE